MIAMTSSNKSIDLIYEYMSRIWMEPQLESFVPKKQRFPPQDPTLRSKMSVFSGSARGWGGGGSST